MTNKKTGKYDILLESAMQMFVKKGYHLTKIKDITDNASLAAGTFYLYFKNKDDLLESLFMQYLNKGIAQLEAVNSKKISPEKKLEALIKENIDFFYENNDFFHIYVEHSTKCDPHEHFKKNIDFVQIVLKMIEKIVIDGQKSGVFRPDINPILAARSFRGMILMNVMSVFVFKDIQAISREELTDNIQKIFIKGITI
jgi:TetR/AcrR family fatty acid metabolism transcriptional regulator